MDGNYLLCSPETIHEERDSGPGYHTRPGGGGGSGEPLGEIVRKNHYRQVFFKKNIVHKKFTGKCKTLGLFFAEL